LLAALAAGVMLAAPMPALAVDAVSHWSARSEAYVTGGPPYQGRTKAMVQIAVHDALNAIARRYVAYTPVPAIFDGGSPEAAIASATYNVLINVESLPPGWPALSQVQRDSLRTEYESYLAGLHGCVGLPTNCVAIGKAAGEAAASAILSLRTNDGATAPHPPYTQPAAPGAYQPTPNATGAPASCTAGPAGAPQFEQWGRVAPFSISSAFQFRADMPAMFDLTSGAYAQDYDEVKRLGRCDAEQTGHRTPEQSLIARYFPAGGLPGSGVARDILEQGGYAFDLWQLAQLFALLNMAQHDANVAVFDTKYAYRFWRPVTAIRAGGTDGNAATDEDPGWLSYLATPPYPDFTCGLTIGSGAAAEVLRRWFGTDFLAWTRTVRSAAPAPAVDITRSYTRLSQATDEAVDARVFGGMHFRTGCVHGVRQGEQIGRFVIEHELKRLRPRDLVD
jgi:hypothetical protein